MVYTPFLDKYSTQGKYTPPLDKYSTEVVYTPRLDKYSSEVVYTPPPLWSQVVYTPLWINIPLSGVHPPFE